MPAIMHEIDMLNPTSSSVQDIETASHAVGNAHKPSPSHPLRQVQGQKEKPTASSCSRSSFKKFLAIIQCSYFSVNKKLTVKLCSIQFSCNIRYKLEYTH